MKIPNHHQCSSTKNPWFDTEYPTETDPPNLANLQSEASDARNGPYFDSKASSVSSTYPRVLKGREEKGEIVPVVKEMMGTWQLAWSQDVWREVNLRKQHEIHQTEYESEVHVLLKV